MLYKHSYLHKWMCWYLADWLLKKLWKTHCYMCKTFTIQCNKILNIKRKLSWCWVLVHISIPASCCMPKCFHFASILFCCPISISIKLCKKTCLLMHHTVSSNAAQKSHTLMLIDKSFPVLSIEHLHGGTCAL